MKKRAIAAVLALLAAFAALVALNTNASALPAGYGGLTVGQTVYYGDNTSFKIVRVSADRHQGFTSSNVCFTDLKPVGATMAWRIQNTTISVWRCFPPLSGGGKGW